MNCELDQDVRAAFSSTVLRVTDTFDFGWLDELQRSLKSRRDWVLEELEE